ncbi:MAG TPA: HNH endonuclease signature motif containing protein [Tepidisphaeraceae bacterium]|nr:HNH endonuclease signature motif containing protein [Tepidisphaeraceae bacterium]
MTAAELKAFVFARAGGRCEYCHLPQSAYPFDFHLEHVVARQHHGPTADHNLAMSCGKCNLKKGPNLSGLDPETGAAVRLFHPRNDRWEEHFHWSSAVQVGLTPTGRATVDVLGINQLPRVAFRAQLMANGEMKG